MHEVHGSASPTPRTVLAPASPALPVQVPSSRPPLVQLPPKTFSLGKNCTPSRAPPVAHRSHDHLSYNQLRELRERRGYSRKDSKAVPETRWASMDEGDRNRKAAGDGAINISETSTGDRGRAPADVVEISVEPLGDQKTRCRAGDLQLACFAETEVVEGHAQWRNPDLKSAEGMLSGGHAQWRARWDATHSSAA